MRILTAADQQRVVTMPEAMEAVTHALIEYSAGRADSPVRTAIPVPGSGGTSLFMPALVEQAGGLGVKFVSVFPRNRELGKRTIFGTVILANVETAEPYALLEASYLTALRTGAAAGLSAKLLARNDAHTIGLIGAGAQAPMQLRGVLGVRPIREVRLFDRHPDQAYRLAQEMSEEFAHRHIRFVVCLTPEDTVRGVDIIITATSSLSPVFPIELVQPGMHIIAIGSFRPGMQELPPGVISPSAKVVVESREAALEESGDLVIPIRDGLFRPEDIYAELGELASGKKPGRERPEEVTVFKSVGLAVMDMVVGKAVYDKAVEKGLGTEVDLFAT
ncbi:MAG TPA: ornithine cyclodeaminase family protein [Symbiobacteriaceae bacterium]|nr:ornithine cyclodeaminase family protein [Symbiobacteriaceae bacterium]